MRLTSIRANNFKSFKDLDIRLDNLNVLIGANASGKSNFVQLFTFIRDIVKEGLENAISIQGGAKYLRNVNCGEGDNLTIELSFEHDAGDNEPFILDLGPQLVVRSVFHFSLAFCDGRRISIAEDEIRMERLDGPTGSRDTFKINRVGNEFHTEGDQGDFGGLLRSFLAPVQTVDVRRPGLLIEYLPWFATLKSIGTYDIDSKAPKSSVFGRPSEIEPDAGNLATVLDKILSDAEGRRKLMNFLKDALPFAEGLDTEALSDRSLLFHMRERFSQHAVPAAFLSDGTIDVIALIVILYFERRSIVIIEEPERNLHPSLMPRLVEYFKDASRLKQIIITTHNPELVRHTDPGQLILISRDVHGYSHAERPVDRAGVKQFLHDEISMHDLYVENLLEV